MECSTCHSTNQTYVWYRGHDTLGFLPFLQGRQLFNLMFAFQAPSEKGSTLKGKNLLPLGANSFLLE